MGTVEEKARISWTFTTPIVAHQKSKKPLRYSYYLPVPLTIIDHLGLADAKGKPNSLVKWSIEAWVKGAPEGRER